MIISYNKNITKLKNNKTLGITITLQRLLQSTKYAISDKAALLAVFIN